MKYNTIKSHFIDKGIPAIIGETSASNKNGNSAERVKWAQYYMGKSAEYSVPCMLWDNNVYNGNDKGECHGHLNRSTLRWNDKSFIDAVIKYGKKGRKPSPSSSSSSAPSAVTGFSKKSSAVTSITLKWNKNKCRRIYHRTLRRRKMGKTQEDNEQFNNKSKHKQT